MTKRHETVGVIVGGSLTKGLEVRMEAGRSAALGQYVMAPLEDGATLLGMVTDIVLKAAESGPTSWPPPAGDDPSAELLRLVLLDTAVFTQADVQPYLEVGSDGAENTRARRLPRHFAPVALADQDAIDRAFDTGDNDGLALGVPLGMESVEVAVDIERMFERSAGIFGKSGTGKTVYALQFLSALIKHSASRPVGREGTVALIFDMHNDYGDFLKFEGGPRRSLKRLHPSDVSVLSLEDGPGADQRLVIGSRDIEPEDLRVLQSISEFTSAALEAADVFHERLGEDWIDGVLAAQPPEKLRRHVGTEEDDWAAVLKGLDIHQATFTAMRRRLRALVRKEFVQSGEAQFSGVMNWIVQSLQGGQSVVVQFGRFGRDIASYMLVANMLSRRIWDAYRRAMDRAGGESSNEPNRLVIVIEEAHKFVDKSLAGQTIFGQIARELRKYNVTLFVIDQRPSQIDSEVLSQIGTKFCLQLDSEADVEALIGGVSGRAGLRQIIASLESRRQALVFGHALPMPVVVQPPNLTPEYGPGASLRARLGVARDAEPPSPRGLFG